MTMLTVYFCSCRGKPRSAIRWIRLSRRQPRKAWLWFVARCIEFFTRCEFTHVCIGDDWQVLVPRPDGDRLFPTPHFVMRAPGLAWAIRFDVDGAMPVGAFVDRLPRSRVWVLSMLTRRDCVAKVKVVLRWSGIPVPWWVSSPASLYDFLRASGGRIVQLNDLGEAHDQAIEDAQRLSAGGAPVASGNVGVEVPSGFVRWGRPDEPGSPERLAASCGTAVCVHRRAERTQGV